LSERSFQKRNDFEANLARIVEVATTEELSVERLSTDQDEINDLFVQIPGLIESAMSPEEAPSTPSVHSERQTPLATLSHINLPRLELHHFSGDPAKWVSFINLYNSTVHLNKV
ncbi:hypothetical protein J6590_107080, partial [Homalodisca vitripennis]